MVRRRALSGEKLKVQSGLLLAGLLLLPLGGWSQSPTAREGRPVRVAVAQRTDQKIKIDGVLDEPAWQTAEPTGGLTQQDPKEGEPASEATEIRVLYDQDNLYVAVWCYDRTPEGIIVNDISRDYSPAQQDFTAVYLDTFHDRSNGYYFGTTPVGGQRDQQISDDGRVSNINWDGAYFAEGRINEQGWVGELAIPFKTLRFSRAKQQLWGFNVIRRIRRNNELDYWSPAPRRYQNARSLPYGGDLIGIENVEPSRNFQVKPYGLTGVKRFASQGKKAEGQLEGGLDAKYGITPGLSLDLTANTDFSEVDADTQQVNLTRFSTFFPEKREFFLENAGLFQFGTLTRDEGLLFQSRTIGLENGNPIPILGGARLSGRSGRNYLGVLNMQTRSEDATPATNFTVARLRRDILGASNLGFMFLNRQSRLPDDYNRSFGADTNLLFFQTDVRVSAALARTLTPGLSGNDRIGKVEADLQNNLLRFFNSYVDVGRDFHPEMGFAQRTGRRFIHDELSARPRFDPESRLGKLKFFDVVTTLSADQVWFSSGGTEEKTLNPSLNVTFIDGSIVDANYTQSFERIVKTFNVTGVSDSGENASVKIPVGDYRSGRTSLSYTTDRSKPFSGNVGYNWGDYYGGTRTGLNLGVQYLHSYRLSASFTYARNNVKLPQGSLHTDQVGMNFSYRFNPKMFFSSFIQYNNQSDQISSNIRFRLIHHPLSDIFVVYNDLRDRAQQKMDWSFSLKYTRLLSF